MIAACSVAGILVGELFMNGDKTPEAAPEEASYVGGTRVTTQRASKPDIDLVGLDGSIVGSDELTEEDLDRSGYNPLKMREEAMAQAMAQRVTSRDNRPVASAAEIRRLSERQTKKLELIIGENTGDEEGNSLTPEQLRKMRENNIAVW